MVDFELDKSSPVPFYRQIVDLVLGGISCGRIAPGEQLPTIRDLAVRLAVNPNTVVKAYAQLQMMGVLDTQQGSGVFVQPRPRGRHGAARKERSLDDLCRDFVARAHMLGFDVDDVLGCLRRMKRS